MLLLNDDSGPGGSGELLAHWKLDSLSGLLALDSSAYHRDAAVICHELPVCNPNWVTGKFSRALGFNGVSDYVSLPYESLHDQGDITLSLWFKTAVGDHTQTLISGAEQFNSNSSRIALSSSNRIYYYTGERSWDYEYWTVAPYADDAWHQLTIVRNDTLNQVTLYLDGVSFGVKYTGLDRIDVEPEALIAGLEQDSVGGRFDQSESFSGELDDIQFIARALPRHEVELAYENHDWNRFSVQIDQASDDAETNASGSISLNSWSIDFHKYESGMRFNRIGIPADATIEKAYVEFRSTSTSSSVISVPIFGELSSNPATFSNGQPVKTRPRTTATTNWDPLPLSWYQIGRTADVSSIIQEIISQSGWTMGNSLALLFDKGADSNQRSAFSYETEPEHAARLVVYFSGGTLDTTPPSAPGNLQATPGTQAISLSWDHAFDAQSEISHYLVYRSKNGGSAQQIVQLARNNFAPAYTDSGLTAGASYAYTVTAVNHAELESPPSVAASTVPLVPSASYAWWSLNETSGITATDIGPNLQHGLLVNGPIWSPNGANGGALEFDGVDDRVDLPFSVLDGAKSVSVSLWLKTTSSANYQSLISGANQYHHDAFRLMLLGGDAIQYMHSSDIIDWDIEPINDDQWHHVMVIADDLNNGVALYVDGIFQGAQRMTLDQIRIDPGGLVVGQDQDTVGGEFDLEQAFAGMLDEIRIEPRVISWTEIQNQILMDTSPPSTPGGLSAIAGDGALVNLNWAAASDAESEICKYRIYRGTAPGNEALLFEVGNVTQVTDSSAANNRAYRYRISAMNCVAMEGELSAVATVTTGSDAGLGLQAISPGDWDQTAVRRILRVFAYGGHASDAQIMSWAGMTPEQAVTQMLTFGKTNPLLSPAEDANVNHAGSLLELQNLWGSASSDNPMRWDKRKDYHSLYFSSSGSTSVSYSNLERAWTQAIATRGLNPFLHKMAFFLSNYQMSVSEFKTRPALIRDYYDTLLHALATRSSFVDVINKGAQHASVAKAYDHDDNTYYNDVLEFEGNDDFAREYFQLFFGIHGESEDPEYHEGVSIENNAMLLTGMELDREANAFGSSDSNDWNLAPIVFSDHIDATGDYVYNQSNHHGNCLEILHEVICGATAADKLDALSPIAAKHVESLANLPVFIISLFADDNLTTLKEKAIQAEWREAGFNLLTFLRRYAISTTFHSSDTYKYLSSFDRNLMLFNLVTLNNEDSFLGLNSNQNVEDWLDDLGLHPFNPIRDVFGHQTGLDAANSPAIFQRNYDFETGSDTLQKTQQLYYIDELEIDATTWYKNWGSTIPDDGGGNYVIADVADWLWNRLVGDGGKNFDIVAKSQLYALLARGDDFGYVVAEALLPFDRAHAFSTDELSNDSDLSALLASLGAETIALGSTDIKGDREEANARVGQAVQFIAMLPYTFAVEGQ